jgi:hypothetical protein
MSNMHHTFVFIGFKPFFSASPQKTHETVENKCAVAAATARTRIARVETPPRFKTPTDLWL